jgi:hypothetical protein
MQTPTSRNVGNLEPYAQPRAGLEPPELKIIRDAERELAQAHKEFAIKAATADRAYKAWKDSCTSGNPKGDPALFRMMNMECMLAMRVADSLIKPPLERYIQAVKTANRNNTLGPDDAMKRLLNATVEVQKLGYEDFPVTSMNFESELGPILLRIAVPLKRMFDARPSFDLLRQLNDVLALAQQMGCDNLPIFQEIHLEMASRANAVAEGSQPW